MPLTPGATAARSRTKISDTPGMGYKVSESFTLGPRKRDVMSCLRQTNERGQPKRAANGRPRFRSACIWAAAAAASHG